MRKRNARIRHGQNARIRHGQESGFALLLVFLMAAMVAISLYLEIPRVAFESQRQKEQLLIERGEQYKRAIQIFVSPRGGMGRWPVKIEDLENTNNRRFLRHRYKDPITGKDEWRLVHIQNGIYTDSVLYKQKNPADQKDASSGAAQSSVSELSGVSALPGVTGAGSNPGQANLNPAMRRRASEGGANPVMIGPDGQPIAGTGPGIGPDGQPYPGAQSYPGAQLYPGGQLAGGVPGTPGAQLYPGTFTPPTDGSAGSQPGMPGYQAQPGMPGYQAQPGMPGYQAQPGMPGYQAQPGMPGYQAQPGMPGYQAQPGMPGYQQGQYPGQVPQYPGMPGPPVNSQTGGVSPSPYPTQPGSQGTPPPFGQPGLPGTNPAQSNAAAAIINQILMTPNPRGLAGVQSAQGNIMGGGIAGVASTAEAEGIMVYNDRTKYNEWEFIWDPTKAKPIPNPNAGGTIGTPASQMGQTFAPGPAPGGAGATMTPGIMPGMMPGTTPGTGPGAKQ